MTLEDDDDIRRAAVETKALEETVKDANMTKRRLPTTMELFATLRMILCKDKTRELVCNNEIDCSIESQKLTVC